MQEGSKPVYRMKIEKNVMVTMRDGIKIACDIYRPDADGVFPALLGMGPYGKDVQMLKLPSMPRMSAEWGVVEAGDTEYFVSRGYAHVLADIRGSGFSEGKFDICQKKEQEDGYDLVEWIAQQQWCNGNVGMLGVSYYAFIQYLVAAQQPPHLKAIFPHDGWGDMYRDISHHGGLLLHGWLPNFSRMLILGWDARPASLEMYSEDELKGRVEKWQKNEVFNKSFVMYNALLFPQYAPLLFDWVINEFDGPYYWERSAYNKFDKIKIPIYLGSEFSEYPVIMHLPGAINGWAGINAPKKLTIRPLSPKMPFYEFHDEILRWYDHWLKGIDTGIMDEPAVRIWVRGADEWRYSTDWPIPETKWTNYYLRFRGMLRENAPAEGETPDSFIHKPVMPISLRGVPLNPKPDSVTYTTEAMEEDIEITGPIALYLYASISGDDADFIVKLSDVSPDGTEFVLTRGWLKASHRELDIERSKIHQPFHPHTRAIPVVPEEINEYAIEIRPMANLFQKGHRIKLEIAGCDYPADKPDLTLSWPYFSHISYEKEVSYKIYHSPLYQSHLLLPVMPGK
ncbi:CocE/NonD family hydrolase [Chloroflexota bacterium]